MTNRIAVPGAGKHHPIMPQTFTIRYLLIVTAVVAASVLVIQSPYPMADAIIYDASMVPPPQLQKRSFTVYHVLAMWPVRFLAYVGSVTLALHTVAVAVGFAGTRKWAFVILLPTAVGAFWKWYSVNRLGRFPGSLTAWDHVQIGLLINTLSCIALAIFLTIPVWTRNHRSTAEKSDA
jgi:hypothetical protein